MVREEELGTTFSEDLAVFLPIGSEFSLVAMEEVPMILPSFRGMVELKLGGWWRYWC